ncbi:T9SS type A sorting domain-containing protein [Chryseobacterium geocarposphaerae]|uniref:Putative delta-60 repeat protein/predicted secreted protein (Por secretion system target) n=1 Tax=Chryseobacterium geocarposphaerae TaxID=1416776 RepID=A0A2M9BY21_9FLAO|nr:T9SS type A sorting domain-containing protein [Chryseobacterium geocarposphaerae]PJJ62966.1 putative delta-60 repeat protein/predicted secreted protein (Por secretion system target) [Chryseobacterium geocarposphaerae]
MKKILLLGCILAIQSIYAQIISKDPSFASNGIYNIGNGNNYVWTMAQNVDDSIYSSYSVPASGQTFLLKLNANGTSDPNFGNNGVIQLPYDTYQCQLKIQPDGKLIVFGHNPSLGGLVYKIFPNGQLDTAFGTNGISTISSVHSSDEQARSIGLILQNGKIIVHGITWNSNTISQHKIYRLNNDGSIDMSFGNNGSVITQGAYPLGTFVLLDNQSNIICMTKTISSNLGNGVIEKFNPDGQPIMSFGNNGILQTTMNFGYVGAAMIDSNNKIVYSNHTYEIFRVNPDGTPDNTFNYNLSAFSGLSGGAWIQSIVEKNGYYYIGGNGEGDFASTYFVSKLNPNGSINSSFGYYSEASNLYSIEEMAVNNDNIIAHGSGYIVKYLLNNSTLSIADILKANDQISFENPVKQSLIYQSEEKISKIEIYSSNGKLVKTAKENNSNVSELPKGVYMIKVFFENGKFTTKKMIKI